MIKIIPVLQGFDQSKQIGVMHLDTSALPDSPDFVFSIGYVQNLNDGTIVLHCVSMLTDIEYLRYLDQKGVRTYV